MPFNQVQLRFKGTLLYRILLKVQLRFKGTLLYRILLKCPGPGLQMISQSSVYSTVYDIFE